MSLYFHWLLIVAFLHHTNSTKAASTLKPHKRASSNYDYIEDSVLELNKESLKSIAIRNERDVVQNVTSNGMIVDNRTLFLTAKDISKKNMSENTANSNNSSSKNNQRIINSIMNKTERLNANNQTLAFNQSVTDNSSIAQIRNERQTIGRKKITDDDPMSVMYKQLKNRNSEPRVEKRYVENSKLDPFEKLKEFFDELSKRSVEEGNFDSNVNIEKRSKIDDSDNVSATSSNSGSGSAESEGSTMDEDLSGENKEGEREILDDGAVNKKITLHKRTPAVENNDNYEELFKTKRSIDEDFHDDDTEKGNLAFEEMAEKLATNEIGARENPRAKILRKEAKHKHIPDIPLPFNIVAIDTKPTSVSFASTSPSLYKSTVQQEGKGKDQNKNVEKLQNTREKLQNTFAIYEKTNSNVSNHSNEDKQTTTKSSILNGKVTHPTQPTSKINNKTHKTTKTLMSTQKGMMAENSTNDDVKTKKVGTSDSKKKLTKTNIENKQNVFTREKRENPKTSTEFLSVKSALEEDSRRGSKKSIIKRDMHHEEEDNSLHSKKHKRNIVGKPKIISVSHKLFNRISKRNVIPDTNPEVDQIMGSNGNILEEEEMTSLTQNRKLYESEIPNKVINKRDIKSNKLREKPSLFTGIWSGLGTSPEFVPGLVKRDYKEIVLTKNEVNSKRRHRRPKEAPKLHKRQPDATKRDKLAGFWTGDAGFPVYQSKTNSFNTNTQLDADTDITESHDFKEFDEKIPLLSKRDVVPQDDDEDELESDKAFMEQSESKQIELGSLGSVNMTPRRTAHIKHSNKYSKKQTKKYSQKIKRSSNEFDHEINQTTTPIQDGKVVLAFDEVKELLPAKHFFSTDEERILESPEVHTLQRSILSTPEINTQLDPRSVIPAQPKSLYDVDKDLADSMILTGEKKSKVGSLKAENIIYEKNNDNNQILGYKNYIAPPSSRSAFSAPPNLLNGSKKLAKVQTKQLLSDEGKHKFDQMKEWFGKTKENPNADLANDEELQSVSDQLAESDSELAKLNAMPYTTGAESVYLAKKLDEKNDPYAVNSVDRQRNIKKLQSDIQQEQENYKNVLKEQHRQYKQKQQQQQQIEEQQLKSEDNNDNFLFKPTVASHTRTFANKNHASFKISENGQYMPMVEGTTEPHLTSNSQDSADHVNNQFNTLHKQMKFYPQSIDYLQNVPTAPVHVTIKSTVNNIRNKPSVKVVNTKPTSAVPILKLISTAPIMIKPATSKPRRTTKVPILRSTAMKHHKNVVVVAEKIDDNTPVVKQNSSTGKLIRTTRRPTLLATTPITIPSQSFKPKQNISKESLPSLFSNVTLIGKIINSTLKLLSQTLNTTANATADSLDTAFKANNKNMSHELQNTLNKSESINPVSNYKNSTMLSLNKPQVLSTTAIPGVQTTVKATTAVTTGKHTLNNASMPLGTVITTINNTNNATTLLNEQEEYYVNDTLKKKLPFPVDIAYTPRIINVNNNTKNIEPKSNGYVGCYIDHLEQGRDLPVRAGIPFVTPNNCMSACKRTGYRYAGLQYGYLCFCGNNYGQYDIVPDSECNTVCSGNSGHTCGGLWRNEIFSTEHASLESNERPVPVYLPPIDSERKHAYHDLSIVPKSYIPSTPSHGASSYNDRIHEGEDNFQSLKSAEAEDLRSLEEETKAAFARNKFGVMRDVQNLTDDDIVNVAKLQEKMDEAAKIDIQTTVQHVNLTNTATLPSKVNTNNLSVNNDKDLLTAYVYLHPQKEDKKEKLLQSPVLPLKIEPGTHLFRGEMMFQQSWYDDLSKPVSSKYRILAGNIEEALKNIFINESAFLKSEVMSLREAGNKIPHKTIADFTLTFKQNESTHAVTHQLFDAVLATSKLDEMPVYPHTLRVREYLLDPNAQAFIPKVVDGELQIDTSVPIPMQYADNNKLTLPLYKLNKTNMESTSSNSNQLNILSTTVLTPSTTVTPPLPVADNSLQHSKSYQPTLKPYKFSPALQTYIKPVVSNSMLELKQYMNSQKDNPYLTQQMASDQNNNQPQLAQHLQANNMQVPSQLAEFKKLSIDQQNNLRNTKKKVPYVLRMFFWKDMLARKKREELEEKYSKKKVINTKVINFESMMSGQNNLNSPRNQVVHEKPVKNVTVISRVREKRHQADNWPTLFKKDEDKISYKTRKPTVFLERRKRIVSENEIEENRSVHINKIGKDFDNILLSPTRTKVKKKRDTQSANNPTQHSIKKELLTDFMSHSFVTNKTRVSHETELKRSKRDSDVD